MEVVDAEPLVDVVGLVGAEVGTVSFPLTPDPAPETHNIDTPTLQSHDTHTDQRHVTQHTVLKNTVSRTLAVVFSKCMFRFPKEMVKD